MKTPAHSFRPDVVLQSNGITHKAMSLVGTLIAELFRHSLRQRDCTDSPGLGDIYLAILSLSETVLKNE